MSGWSVKRTLRDALDRFRASATETDAEDLFL